MKRRTFLKYSCLGGVNAWFFTSSKVLAEVAKSLNLSNSAEKSLDLNSSIEKVALIAQPIEIIRPADLLNLRFEFVNLKLVGDSALERINSNEDAFIRIIFPPQHILEQAFNENKSVSAPPVNAEISGPSRLVFRIPKGMNSIPYTLSGLLSWGQLEPSLVPAAIESSYKIRELTQLQLRHSSRTRISGFAAKLYLPGVVAVKDRFNFSKANNTIFGKINGSIIEPGPDHTAIEAPTRLILSPHQLSAWAHNIDPFAHPAETEIDPSDQTDNVAPPTVKPVSSGVSKTVASSRQASRLLFGSQAERTELWHTRLGLGNKLMPFGVDEQTDLYRTVRAVYSPDYTNVYPPDSTDANCGESEERKESLTVCDRNQIVHLSADEREAERNSIQANRLMLSSLGAWLDLQGDWTLLSGSKYSLESWTHRAIMGRDTFVRVVYKGYLFPFGHRASQIFVTERRVENGIAYLLLYEFVVVREPEKQYPKDSQGLDDESIEGRRFPFRSVRIKTLVTPKLNPNIATANGWIMADGKDFLFKMEAEDWDGNVCEFMAPLNFVLNTEAESPWTSTPSDIQFVSKALYFKERYDIRPERSERPMYGQRIAYAPSTGADDPGATGFETDRMVFGFGMRKKAEKGELLFYPTVNSAKVRLSAACMISGRDTSATIKPFQPFVEKGFGAGNSDGQVFAQVPDPVPLGFSADRSGGVATPNMNIRGLSRRFGIIGGPAGKDAADDTWKKDLEALATFDITKSPEILDEEAGVSSSYFSRFLEGAKLLGDISLGDIINPEFEGGKNIPKFQSLPEYDANGELVAIKHRFEWNPSIDSFSAFVPDPGATFRLTNETRQMLDGSEPTTLTSGVLTNFSITPLRGTKLEFVTVGFGSFSFTSRNGEKPDFDVQGLTFTFLNDLAFFNGLAAFLDDYQDNFSDPPSMSVTSEGIKLGYTLAIPDVPCGTFLMKNIAFSAGMTLPFNGPLSLDLAFASRDNPFTLAVNLLGGGGFVGLGVGMTKLNYVEASLEAGAIAEVNFGVAKGSVHAMLGVYFIIKNEAAGDTVEVTAYFRCGGSVNVLHLITASIELYLALSYGNENNQLTGYGEIKVEVDVAFFSKTVTLSMQKTYSTASLEQDRPMYAGLPFIDDEYEVPPDSFWSAYGAAFADTTGGLA